MKILHTSDLHGMYRILGSITEFDVWVDTGDFFPNETRGDRNTEPAFQNQWLLGQDIPRQLATWLNGRPMISVGGNHDYVSLVEALQTVGVDAHEVTPGGIEVAGLTWAGFRYVPWMAGEWNGEIHDFSEVVRLVWNTEPDILVTHSPPAGILDECPSHGGGISALMTALCWKPHKIQAHFFGHIHDFGGKAVNEMGILFANGANAATVHTI